MIVTTLSVGDKANCMVWILATCHSLGQHLFELRWNG